MTYHLVNVFRISQGARSAAFRFVFAATVRNGITVTEMRVLTPAGVVINSATLELQKVQKSRRLSPHSSVGRS